MNSSRMLDAAAPVPVSAKRTLAINAVTGLIAGLFIGLGFVIVRALISDRLWKRQDIARSLGARVRLSTGRPPRWRCGRSRSGCARRSSGSPEIQLMVQHLDQRIFWAKRPTPALAVVSVDDVKACALAVASLAVSYWPRRQARPGRRPHRDRPARRDARRQDARHARVAVQRAGQAARRLPAGPGRRTGRGLLPAAGRQQPPGGSGDIALDAAWDVADVVLTLATLTPALGADHLGTWASPGGRRGHRGTVDHDQDPGDRRDAAAGRACRSTPPSYCGPDRTDEGVGDRREPEAGRPGPLTSRCSSR